VVGVADLGGGVDAEVPFRFLTNNSQRGRHDVATKLQRLGIEVEDEHSFTCARATAQFLAAQKPGGTAFVIGEGGLRRALDQAGHAIVDRDPDYVVVGEGRTLGARASACRPASSRLDRARLLKRSSFTKPA